MVTVIYLVDGEIWMVRQNRDTAHAQRDLQSSPCVRITGVPEEMFTL